MRLSGWLVHRGRDGRKGRETEPSNQESLSGTPYHTHGTEVVKVSLTFNHKEGKLPEQLASEFMLIWIKILKVIMKEGGWLEMEVNPQGRPSFLRTPGIC